MKLTHIVTINMNAPVKVKLLPEGMIHLLENYKNIVGNYGEHLPRIDEDGYYKTQLHELVNIFGEDAITEEGCKYFKGNYIIDAKPVFFRLEAVK